jgi:hypothetical protein
MTCVLCLAVVTIVGPIVTYAQSRQISVEVFQVPELPLTINDVVLVQSEKGYSLKCSLSNSSELKMVGLRYSLIEIDSTNRTRALANRTEGFLLEAYAAQGLKFLVPIRSMPEDGSRLILMLEQTISSETIWEVMKAKEALEAYAKGDYSVVPRVLRGPNQVDVPPGGRLNKLKE